MIVVSFKSIVSSFCEAVAACSSSNSTVDNFIVIQNCAADELHAINRVNGYWDKMPEARADYIFRMFEPDGQEALCCGNGLMCLANYMSEVHRVEEASIMTEIPLARTNRTAIGYMQGKSYGWVNLGHPRKFPAEIGARGSCDAGVDEIQTIDDLHIRFRSHDLHPCSSETELRLSGYLTFTGEPHLVFLLDDEDSPLAEFADAIFAGTDNDRSAGPLLRRRNEFGTWLVNHIGHYLNTHYREIFPAGVNVNFARLDRRNDAIEYRCYERGVYKETLACGTGAVAVAFIMQHFQGLAGSGQIILPHRCRWFKPQAVMAVSARADGWLLEGQPEVVAEIDFRFEQPPGEGEYLPRLQAGRR